MTRGVFSFDVVQAFRPARDEGTADNAEIAEPSLCGLCELRGFFFVVTPTRHGGPEGPHYIERARSEADNVCAATPLLLASD